MADFFQPGPATGSQTGTKTPSPADQAMAKFRAELFGRLLNAMGGAKPSFGDFLGGAPATRAMPEGMGAGMEAVLQAMSQPGAFTWQASESSELRQPEPSILSDLVQFGVLGKLVMDSGVLEKILGPVGGMLKIGGSVGPAGASTDAIDSGIPVLAPGGELIPGGGAVDVPSDYPGLLDDDSGLLASLLSYFQS